jgi:FkbM family methyltransferase
MHVPPMNDLHRKTLELMQAGGLHVHFSQWGEDIVLWHFLRQKRKGFYVDVGAHHPHNLSNTALLHHYNDWTGINVEPDERLMQVFRERRPNDINLCCGVGAETGVAKMAIFEDGAVNSFDKEAVELQITRAGKKLSEWREVPIRTLKDILDTYLPAGRTVDLLNVDAEGWDVIVLKSNDWHRYRPEFILVEDHKMYLPKLAENETFQLLSGYGYRLLSQVLATSIYKREP